MRNLALASISLLSLCSFAADFAPENPFHQGTRRVALTESQRAELKQYLNVSRETLEAAIRKAAPEAPAEAFQTYQAAIKEAVRYSHKQHPRSELLMRYILNQGLALTSGVFAADGFTVVKQPILRSSLAVELKAIVLADSIDLALDYALASSKSYLVDSSLLELPYTEVAYRRLLLARKWVGSVFVPSEVRDLALASLDHWFTTMANFEQLRREVFAEELSVVERELATFLSPSGAKLPRSDSAEAQARVLTARIDWVLKNASKRDATLARYYEEDAIARLGSAEAARLEEERRQQELDAAEHDLKEQLRSSPEPIEDELDLDSGLIVRAGAAGVTDLEGLAAREWLDGKGIVALMHIKGRANYNDWYGSDYMALVKIDAEAAIPANITSFSQIDDLDVHVEIFKSINVRAESGNSTLYIKPFLPPMLNFDLQRNVSLGNELTWSVSILNMWFGYEQQLPKNMTLVASVLIDFVTIAANYQTIEGGQDVAGNGTALHSENYFILNRHFRIEFGGNVNYLYSGESSHTYCGPKHEPWNESYTPEDCTYISSSDHRLSAKGYLGAVYELNKHLQFMGQATYSMYLKQNKGDTLMQDAGTRSELRLMIGAGARF